MSGKEWSELQSKHAVLPYSDLDQDSEDIVSSDNNQENAPVIGPDGNRLKLSALLPVDQINTGSSFEKGKFDNKTPLHTD